MDLYDHIAVALGYRPSEPTNADAVPRRFRNLINPWQTVREIRAQVRTANQIASRLYADDRASKAFTREDEEDRAW